MPETVQSESEKKKEDWMNSKWRPMMGWMYMFVCTCDFVIFPVLWSVVQTLGHGQITNQWQPITLQGAGLFHMAMGAIIGVAAFGRTQEKLAGVNNGINTGYGNSPSSGFGNPSSSFNSPSSGFGNPSSNFNNPSNGFNNPSSGFDSTPTKSMYAGKPGPAAQVDPPL
jgi:Holin of 3TMs, for gene-transfer release